MAFIPNTTCLLYKNIGYNTFGEPKFGRGELTRCAIVKLIGADEKTTVRSDIAASKSHAIDDIVDAKILFKSNCKVEKGDKVEIWGYTITITKKHPRLNIYGKLDHYECDGVIL